MKKVLYGTWVAIRTVGRAIGAAGRAAVVLVGIAGIMLAHADYLATVPGTGTTFASIVISTKHYVGMLICDFTVGETQCAAVDNVGNVSVKDAAVLAAVTSPIPAGTNNIGFVTPTPGTAGGWSKWSTAKNNSNTPLTTTVVQVKGSAGTFGGYYISNANTSQACLQVFDAATAGAVTLGTTRPDLVFCIPAGTGNPGAANLEFVNGVNFASGIQVAWTTTASGNTAPATGSDTSILFK